MVDFIRELNFMPMIILIAGAGAPITQEKDITLHWVRESLKFLTQIAFYKVFYEK